MKKSFLRKRILILLLLAVLFFAVAVLAIAGLLQASDAAVYAAIAQFINPRLTSVVLFITGFGDGLTVTAVVLVLLVIPSTRKAYGVSCTIASILGGIAIFSLKELFAQNRPDILWLTSESGYGLPSGHTTIATVLFLTILFTALRSQKKPPERVFLIVVCSLVFLLVGVSRIYLGVHYASDVLAGWLLGGFIAILIDTVLRQLRKSMTAKTR